MNDPITRPPGTPAICLWQDARSAAWKLRPVLEALNRAITYGHRRDAVNAIEKIRLLTEECSRALAGEMPTAASETLLPKHFPPR